MKQTWESFRRAVEARPSLVAWNFFFLLELYLYLAGAIRLDVVLNLAFLAFLLLPTPRRLASYRSVAALRTAVSVLAAILLLWHQSWLPTLAELAVLLDQYGLPSLGYMASFATSLVGLWGLLVLGVLAAITVGLRRHGAVALASLPALLLAAPFVAETLQNYGEPYPLSAVAVAEARETADPSRYLDAFHAAESERVILLKEPDAAQPPFDIVVLHVCSLSWDDLQAIGLGPDAPFFQQFDYLLTDFNTATGYSGPAMLRLLQANCGQRPHRDVHADNTPKACLLFEGLAASGYSPFISMSHDGEYGEFLSSVQRNVSANTVVLSPEELQPQAIFFDGKTPLYNDHEVLGNWLAARRASGAERVALYHNSVLLHAGVRWVGERTSRGRNAQAQFADVTAAFFEDVEGFIEELATSERNTVLLFVPEHGRALFGSPFQPADVRDIPLPKITKVPVGVKLIGPQFKDREVRPTVVSKPTSYLALSWLLARYVERSPFGADAQNPEDLAFRMPRTEFVAEHEGRVVMEMDGKYLYRAPNGRWETLTARQLR